MISVSDEEMYEVFGDEYGLAVSGQDNIRDTPAYANLRTTSEDVEENQQLFAESLPGVGEYVASSEIVEGFTRPEGPGLDTALQGAGLMAGLVPFVGDIVGRKLRREAKELVPNMEEIAEIKAFREDPDAIEEWQGINRVSNRNDPPREVTEAANQLAYGEIPSRQWRDTVKENMPIEIITESNFPKLPTKKDIVGSLASNQRGKILNVDVAIEDGERVASRLDINAYQDYNTWVVSIHGSTKGGKTKGEALAYGQVAILKDVEFTSSAQTALNISRRKNVSRKDKAGGRKIEKTGKSTIARIDGDFYNSDPEDTWEIAHDIVKNKDPEWEQIGMNPDRASFFYNKETGMPVFGAEEVIQVGRLVLARGIKKPTVSEYRKLKISPAGRPEKGELLDRKLRQEDLPTGKRLRVFNRGGLMRTDYFD